MARKAKELEVIDVEPSPEAAKELAVVEPAQVIAEPKGFNPALMVKQAQEAARAVMEVAKPLQINGKEYFRFEDWQLIGSFYNVTAGIEWTKPLVANGELHGYNAMANVYKNGVKIGGAEATCLKSEKRWQIAPEFQIKSMAQTRAMAKALRSVLGQVAILAGVEATPAEEMNQSMTTDEVQVINQETQEVATDNPICPIHKKPMKYWPGGISKKNGNPYNPRYACGLKLQNGAYCSTPAIWIDEDAEFDKKADEASSYSPEPDYTRPQSTEIDINVDDIPF